MNPPINQSLSKKSREMNPGLLQHPDLFHIESALESFRADDSLSHVVRSVRAGGYSGSLSLAVSRATAEGSFDASSEFDKAWLRNVRKPLAPAGPTPLSVVDLFAGCGGLSLGVLEAATALGRPFQSRLACDLDHAALSVYSANLEPQESTGQSVDVLFPHAFGAAFSETEGSIRKRHGEPDFLIGGPPCQGHSDLNNHTRRHDPRNDLYGVMARAAQVLNPRFVIIENVPGVKHSQNGVVDHTLAQLQELGYHSTSLVLNAADFGVAQNRKRHFSIATRGVTSRVRLRLAALQRSMRPVLWAIDDLIDAAEGSTRPFDTPSVHSAENRRRIEFLFREDLFDLPNSERPACHRLKVHSYNSVYGRLHPDRPAPTITGGFGSTGQGRFVHPHRRRTLTPHEAARIQFFPDWFTFGDARRSELQKQIGNAVPSRLGYALALALLDSVDETPQI